MENNMNNVITILPQQFIQLIVAANVAGWVQEQDSSALDYATFRRHEYTSENLFTVLKTKDTLNLVAYGSESLDTFPEVLNWVSNK